jgi:hypothetical protein
VGEKWTSRIQGGAGKPRGEVMGEYLRNRIEEGAWGRMMRGD